MVTSKVVLTAVLSISIAAAGEMGDAEDFWEDLGHSAYDMDLVYTDYSSGEPELWCLWLGSGEPEPLGVAGRFPAGMGAHGVGGTFANPMSLIYEVSGEDGWALAVALAQYDAEPFAFISGPGENIQPEVFGNRCATFCRENEDGGYDIALWTSNSGVKVLNLDLGDEMWPTFYYAASTDELAPPEANPYTYDYDSSEMDPLRKWSALVFQGNPEGAYRLYYVIVGPGGEVERTGSLDGKDFDFEGEMMCPDIPNQYNRLPVGYLDDWTKLAFHGLMDDNRDIYLTEVTLATDSYGEALTCFGLERLTDWPGQEKFPELYMVYDFEAEEPATWCFFAADRDGDYDIYALWVEKGRFYQLTDLPGMQTAPLVMTTM